MKKEEGSVSQGGVCRRDAIKIMSVGVGALAGGLALGGPLRRAYAEAPNSPFKLAVVAFSTGPVASYGYPAHEMLDILVPMINKKGGILGRKIELIKHDEGPVSKVVETVKRLTKNDKVDAILGFASSANGLAAAPICEESRTLMIACLCRTHKVTWQNPEDPTKFRKYIKRSLNDTITHAAAAALMVAKFYPGAKVAHIHPDYAYGHEIHDIFHSVLEKVDPTSEAVVELWPKLFTPDYSPHIQKLLSANPDIVFNSFWGGDSMRFSDQCIQRGLTSKAKLLGDHGEFYSAAGRDLPNELIGHPPFPVEGLPTAPDPKRWPLNQFGYDIYYNQHKNTPPAAASFAACAFYSLIAAIEKAAALIGEWPNNEQIADAFTGLAAPTPLGWIVFREDGKGNSPKWAGQYKLQPPYHYGVDNLYHMPIEEICAPVGVDPIKWIETW